jgi:hypothetical protein
MRPLSTTTTSSAFSAVLSRCAMVTEVRPDMSRSSARADAHLELRVDRARGLVEDQQVGVGQVGAQQGDELPLPRRQRLAALADPVSRPLGQAVEPVDEAELDRGGADLGVGRVEPAVADVLADRVVEEEALLRHQHDRTAQARLGSRGRRRRRAAPRRPVGSISRVSSLASVDLPDPVSPTTATRVPGAMPGRCRAAPAVRRGRRTRRRANSTSIGPRGSTDPSGPGSTRSAGVSRMPITRRQPAMAFCASVRIWVPIWTGITNSVTRKANASTSPAVISPRSRARSRRSGRRRWPGHPRARRARTRRP